MHKLEKIWLGLGMGSLVLFLGIIFVSALHNGHEPIASGREFVDPELIDKHEVFSKPGLHKVEGKDWDYELVFVVSAFNYNPGEVEIPKGAKVKIIATSRDVVHGFEIAQTNVNMMIEPGHISSFVKTFDKKGEYLLLCNEYCGTGHADMKSNIKVVDKK
ncbi:cytochrome c oxidase subunit II [Macrococcoides caseolyticum]|uniref:cytochrome c oxidase subunit II n=1 Tax=Macrococcoides caseolyticum TaxID=69966 RepID=UPI001F1C8F30|nr:cytochrome c oxidase subunit II [Macrococcus caseolyticus]MCE4957038.1 cytochrome c oxidase subunit II [Macrococcus caseolyticus]